jgi:hypothetical protein
MLQLGDVYAHFGMWPAAGAAWNSALDALLGPYQVVSSWTRKLELGCGWQQLLGRYGVHGLLLAGTLLGKLARWAAAAEQCWGSAIYLVKQLVTLYTASATVSYWQGRCWASLQGRQRAVLATERNIYVSSLRH